MDGRAALGAVPRGIFQQLRGPAGSRGKPFLFSAARSVCGAQWGRFDLFQPLRPSRAAGQTGSD